jgi:hypothetical protein
MPCLSAACLLTVWGYTLPTPDIPVQESTKVNLSSYEPVNKCELALGRSQVVTGCRKVPHERDPFWADCGGGYECPVRYKLKPADWGDKKLPPVRVTAPKKRIAKTRPHKPAMLAFASIAQPGSTPGKSNAGQIAEQLARYGVMTVAQFKAAAVGCSVGAGFGGVGCPIGAILASWSVCTSFKYAFLYQDWAVKERWDLHPEKAWGNWWWSYKMCSPAGFIFRAIEAGNNRDKAFALAEGLSWAPLVPLSIAGQVAPATNAALYNLEKFGTSQPH